MRKNMMLATGLVLVWGWAARGETIVLKDGTFVDGKIVVQTSRTVRLKTRYGERTFQRRDIDQIIDTTSTVEAEAVNKLSELPQVYRDVLNAQADYDLGNYERALKRIEPHAAYTDNKALRLKIDWLGIEIRQRLGKWDEVKRLLEDKEKNGNPSERIRAKAHREIMEANTFKGQPGENYSLRFVGEVHARNFIRSEELRNSAREPDALRDAQLFRLALEEYCRQKLQNERVSVNAFRDRLNADSRRTYEACRNLPPAGDVDRHMPYFEDMRKVENSLREVRAILDDFGEIYELDLVRVEAEHLVNVLQRLLEDMLERNPESAAATIDARTGRLTREGRENWIRACDEYLREIKLVQRIVAYMSGKCEPYPQELRDMNQILDSLNNLLTELEKTVKKARERSRV